MTSSAGHAALRFLALGDSYTIGEGVTVAERWPHLLAGLLRDRDVRIDDPVIIARTGWTTNDLEQAIDAAAPSGPFALVTVLIGVNDQYRARDRASYEAAFARLLARAIDLAGGSADHVVVMSIPDWSVTPFAAGSDTERVAREIDDFNSANREAARRAGAHYVDVTGMSRRVESDQDSVASDGLHPSGRMYARWAAAILPVALEITKSAAHA